MFILIIGLSACCNSLIHSSNASVQDEKAMLNEIYDSNITPDYVLKMQENKIDVNTIVLKYFKMGESKEEVLSKLTQMKLSSNKKSDNRIVVSGIKGNDPLFCKDDDKTVELSFEFDRSSKLANIKSRYFRRQ
jgi:hypothetical protein